MFVFVFFSTSPAVWGICLLPRVSARDCHSIPRTEVWRESPLHGEGPHAQLLPGRQGGALNVRATASALTTRAENHRPQYTARSGVRGCDAWPCSRPTPTLTPEGKGQAVGKAGDRRVPNHPESRGAAGSPWLLTPSPEPSDLPGTLCLASPSASRNDDISPRRALAWLSEDLGEKLQLQFSKLHCEFPARSGPSKPEAGD